MENQTASEATEGAPPKPSVIERATELLLECFKDCLPSQRAYLLAQAIQMRQIALGTRLPESSGA